MIMKCKITKKMHVCGFFSKISQTPKKTFEQGRAAKIGLYYSQFALFCWLFSLILSKG